MNNADRDLRYCLIKVSRWLRDGDSRNASRCMMRYVEKNVVEQNLPAIDRLLIACLEKHVALKEINKVALLRTCWRLRHSLEWYPEAMSRWRKELREAGLENLLIGMDDERLHQRSV